MPWNSHIIVIYLDTHTLSFISFTVTHTPLLFLRWNSYFFLFSLILKLILHSFYLATHKPIITFTLLCRSFSPCNSHTIAIFFFTFKLTHHRHFALKLTYHLDTHTLLFISFTCCSHTIVIFALILTLFFFIHFNLETHKPSPSFLLQPGAGHCDGLPVQQEHDRRRHLLGRGKFCICLILTWTIESGESRIVLVSLEWMIESGEHLNEWLRVRSRGLFSCHLNEWLRMGNHVVSVLFKIVANQWMGVGSQGRERERVGSQWYNVLCELSFSHYSTRTLLNLVGSWIRTLTTGDRHGQRGPCQARCARPSAAAAGLAGEWHGRRYTHSHTLTHTHTHTHTHIFWLFSICNSLPSFGAQFHQTHPTLTHNTLTNRHTQFSLFNLPF